MDISVIIPTRERIKYLNRCIKSIELQTEIPDEIVLIVHKDDQKTKEYITNLKTNLKINYYQTDGGTCKGRNLGIKKSNGEILIFIDDDVILEKNYVKNLKVCFENYDLDVLTGYTLDLVDIITPWFVKKNEINYLVNNENEFTEIIKEELNKNNPEKFKIISNKKNLIIYNTIRFFRNLIKTIFLQEWPVKGKILPSGYRSEMPDVICEKELFKVEWFGGENFAAKKYVLTKYYFNEEMETLPYVLGEDLELSARLGQEYNIFLNPKMKVFHSRAPSNYRVNNRAKFRSIVINFNRIVEIKGNKIAYYWGLFGIIISRIVKLPFDYLNALSELEGIIEGIKYLRNKLE